jgi:hypothetical protein
VVARQDHIVRKQDSNRLVPPAPQHRVTDAEGLRLENDFDRHRMLVIGQVLCEGLFAGAHHDNGSVEACPFRFFKGVGDKRLAPER